MTIHPKILAEDTTTAPDNDWRLCLTNDKAFAYTTEEVNCVNRIWVQITIGALCVTFSRGILNALNACGAYGTGDVETATIVNLGSSISFALVGWTTGAIINKAGFRISCFIGAVGTTVLLCMILGRSILHVVPVGYIWCIGLFDGIGSGILWTSVSTITITAPPEHQKGFASTILFAVFSTGAALGGLLAFSLNLRTNTNMYDLSTALGVEQSDGSIGGTAIDIRSYCFMIFLTCISIFLAFLISPRPHEDDLQPRVNRSNDFENLINALQEPDVQKLLVFAFASLFHQTYLFNGLNYGMFNMRTRGLNCFMYWLGRIPAVFVHGHVVDDMGKPPRGRAWSACFLLLFHIILAQSIAFWFWNIVVVGDGGLDVVRNPGVSAFGFCAFFLYGGLDTVSQALALWLISILGKDSPRNISHFVAVYRCFQGFGVAFAWGLELSEIAPYKMQFAVSIICWLLALPGLLIVIGGLKGDDALGSSFSSSSILCGSCDCVRLGM